MPEVDYPDLEPAVAQADESAAAPTKSSSARRSLVNARRELSDEELKSPAAIKLILDDVDRLEQENGNLSNFRDKFYEADRRCAVYEERHKRVISQEIISNACLTVGAAALGYIPSLSTSQENMTYCAIFGIVLLVAGIWAKVARL